MKASTAILLFSLCILPGLVQSQTFSRQAVLEDFETLRHSLNDAHYQVDVYTPMSTLDSLYRVIRSEIQADSFTFLETTNLFQRYIGAIQNGHTEIDFPISSYMEYATGGGTIFPLEIAIEDGTALIRKNWSDQESILPGMQLLSIDGVEIDRVLAEIYPQIPGERLYFKQAKLEFFSFPRYAWQIFGEQETFRVKILAQGTIKPYTLKAVPVIEGFEARREEILNAQQHIEFLPQAAYLNPGDLSGDEPKFQAFIDSAFTEIRKQQAKNLIIDLRNNRGGNNSFSDYLVAYIADQPFRWNDRFTLKTSAFLKTFVRENYDTTDVYWREVLDRQDGEIYDFTFEPVDPMPKNKRFQGEVYILINRQSYSQSAVTAAQIQDYGWGTIVGEETGEFPSLYASQFQYPLPNTGIIVKVSKGQIVRVSGRTKAEGVIPDIKIRDHLLDEEDEILEGLLERLK